MIHNSILIPNQFLFFLLETQNSYKTQACIFAFPLNLAPKLLLKNKTWNPWKQILLIAQTQIEMSTEELNF